MRKIIAAINTTLDAVCDHTAGVSDEELHQHYTQLLDQAGTVLYGRTTYQLMEFWRPLLESPLDDASMNDFARAIDTIPKVVFSHTLENVDWKSATLAKRGLIEEVSYLRQQPGKDILVGSRSLIIQLMERNLIDELQLCIHPLVAGGGLPLFEGMGDKKLFKLINTKTFGSGAVILYYEPSNTET